MEKPVTPCKVSILVSCITLESWVFCKKSAPAQSFYMCNGHFMFILYGFQERVLAGNEKESANLPGEFSWELVRRILQPCSVQRTRKETHGESGHHCPSADKKNPSCGRPFYQDLWLCFFSKGYNWASDKKAENILLPVMLVVNIDFYYTGEFETGNS